MEIDPKREEIRRRGKYIRDLLKDDTTEPAYTAYEKFTLDLGIARTNMEFQHSGDMLFVKEIDGDLNIRLHHKQAPLINLKKVRKFSNTPFERFFLSNSVQNGRETIILVGRTKLFSPEIGLSHIYHDSGDAVLFTAESLAATDLLTHYNIELTGYESMMIMASATAQTTWYPQFSHDSTNWYDYTDASGTVISFIVNNQKMAIPISNCQARYFRMVVYANAAAIVNGDLSLQS